MNENTTATVLKSIGILLAVGAVFAGGAVGGDSVVLGVTIVISGIISCALFCGFSEIILLLQAILERGDVINDNGQIKPKQQFDDENLPTF